jgi:polyhydroxyalkanoate synthesis regulator protein
MRTIIKYDNRKLYDKESGKYTTVTELIKLPLDTFVVERHGTKQDVTTDTLLGILTNENIENEIKVKVMRHCIAELEGMFQ